jgi:hypothetical protein
MPSLYKIKRPDGSIEFQSDLLVTEQFFLTEGWYDIHELGEESGKNYNHIWFLDSDCNMMCYKVGIKLYSEYFNCYFNSKEEFERAWSLKVFA